jgi:hypothetical protein
MHKTGDRVGFPLFLLFSPQVISDHHLFLRGNPGLSLGSTIGKQRDRPLFFRCFPLFYYKITNCQYGATVGGQFLNV